MSWAVVESDDGWTHVMPWDDAAGDVGGEHTATLDCWCHPSTDQDAPLDAVVLNHHHPGWPGASDLLA